MACLINGIIDGDAYEDKWEMILYERAISTPSHIIRYGWYDELYFVCCKKIYYQQWSKLLYKRLMADIILPLTEVTISYRTTDDIHVARCECYDVLILINARDVAIWWIEEHDEPYFMKLLLEIYFYSSVMVAKMLEMDKYCSKYIKKYLFDERFVEIMSLLKLKNIVV